MVSVGINEGVSPATMHSCKDKRILREMIPSTISFISLWSNGSPPGIETTGAPHSSTAARHSFAERRLLSICFFIINLTAARTGKIASEQRFQHQHQGVASRATNPLLQHVGVTRTCCIRGTDTVYSVPVKKTVPGLTSLISGGSLN